MSNRIILELVPATIDCAAKIADKSKHAPPAIRNIANPENIVQFMQFPKQQHKQRAFNLRQRQPEITSQQKTLNGIGLVLICTGSRIAWMDIKYVPQQRRSSNYPNDKAPNPTDTNVERQLTDAGDDDVRIEGSSAAPRKPILEQDRFLPIANISRLMKNVIPRSGKVAKDAKECVQECVSEFISFITSEACDRCLSEKRKTITGEDIINAFSTLGFDNYVDPLNTYMKKFREAFRTDRSNETLLVDAPISQQPSFLEKTASQDPNDSTSSAGEVFTIQSESMPSSSGACASSQFVFSGDDNADGSVRVVSTGNVQHLQLLMDPSTGQHYINVQSPNGTQQLLPVQVSAVEPGTAPLTINCPDTQGASNAKTGAKDGLVPEFTSGTEYRPSASKSGNIPSTSYKEALQIAQHSGESSRNGSGGTGIIYGINLKHHSTAASSGSGRCAANQHHKQHQQHVAYGIVGTGQFGQQHHTDGTPASCGSSSREHSRKRSHESIEYLSFD